LYHGEMEMKIMMGEKKNIGVEVEGVAALQLTD
jgi:hypothetical protein